jgi:hypothetical protein
MRLRALKSLPANRSPLHANRVSGKGCRRAPGNGFPGARDERPQTTSGRVFFLTETVNGPMRPLQTAENPGCSAETGKIRVAQDCVVGWKDSNLQPDHYGASSRWGSAMLRLTSARNSAIRRWPPACVLPGNRVSISLFLIRRARHRRAGGPRDRSGNAPFLSLRRCSTTRFLKVPPFAQRGAYPHRKCPLMLFVMDQSFSYGA